MTQFYVLLYLEMNPFALFMHYTDGSKSTENVGCALYNPSLEFSNMFSRDPEMLVFTAEAVLQKTGLDLITSSYQILNPYLQFSHYKGVHEMLYSTVFLEYSDLFSLSKYLFTASLLSHIVSGNLHSITTPRVLLILSGQISVGLQEMPCLFEGGFALTNYEANGTPSLLYFLLSPCCLQNFR